METQAAHGYGTIVRPSARGLERKFQRSGKELKTRKKLLVRPRPGFTVTDENMAAIKDQVLVNEIEYLVLDPLYKIQTQGTGLNDDKAIAHVTTNLDRLTEETGCQIILIHHNNKSKTAAGGHKIMGSNLIHGWAPQLWLLQKGEEAIIRGETSYRVSVSPDFRSMAREWKEKNLLYSGWRWTEEGQYLPGEKKVRGRKADPKKQMFLERMATGEYDGMAQKDIADDLGLNQGTVSRWMKYVSEEPDKL
jgi:hypothetical protein